MIIASAQTKPFENTNENIQDHLRLVKLAANKGAKLILFPEMSLTGYQREDAESFSFSIDDPRLSPLIQQAVLHQIVIVAGAPIKIGSQLYIGSFILLPNGIKLIYTKQFLHTGEDLFFSSGSVYNPTIELENEIISFAICADITNPIHPENAVNQQTTLYLASIFYTPNGISEGHRQLSEYARKHSLKIGMANFGGPSYIFEAGGKSAFWDKTGSLIAHFENQEDQLLITTI